MTTVETVKEQIETLLNNRAEALQRVNEAREKLSEEIERLSQEKERAVEAMDEAGYSEISSKLIKARTALEMYGKKADQLRRDKLVTEQESDDVIESLIQYEQDLEQSFAADVQEIMDKLSERQAEHNQAWKEAEGVLLDWVTNIHENYRSRYTRYADGTDRADKPVPVHPYGTYNGGSINNQVTALLKQMQK